MKIKEGYILKSVVGNHMVIPTGQTSVEFKGVITLNSTGAFLWEKMAQKDVSIEEMAKAVADEYDIDKETAKEDAEKFVSLLKEKNLIEM